MQSSLSDLLAVSTEEIVQTKKRSCATHLRACTVAIADRSDHRAATGGVQRSELYRWEIFDNPGVGDVKYLNSQDTAWYIRNGGTYPRFNNE